MSEMSPEKIRELSEHYAAACKGVTRALLMALDDGVRVSFQAILNGYINQGCITEKGRAYLRSGADA